MRLKPFAYMIVLAAGLIVSYQQCSPVNFSTMDTSVGGLKATGEPDATDGAGSSDANTNETDGDDHAGQNPTGACVDISKKNVQISQVGDETIVRTPCLKESDKSCVVLCHVPPGNPAAKHTIIVGEPARKAHILGGPHGHNTDYDGPCREFEPETEQACEYK